MKTDEKSPNEAQLSDEQLETVPGGCVDPREPGDDEPLSPDGPCY
jgi:hypothetical protein